jgi:hypothetical protein
MIVFTQWFSFKAFNGTVAVWKKVRGCTVMWITVQPLFLLHARTRQGKAFSIFRKSVEFTKF